MSRVSENLGIASGLAFATAVAAGLGVALATFIPPAFGSVRPVLSDEHGCLFQVPEKPEDPAWVFGCSGDDARKQARTELEAAATAANTKGIPSADDTIPGVNIAFKQAEAMWPEYALYAKVGVGVFGLWMLLVTVMAFRKRTVTGATKLTPAHIGQIAAVIGKGFDANQAAMSSTPPTEGHL